MKWYVLYVMSGKDEEIQKFLKKEGFDAFVCRKEVIYRKNGFPVKEVKLMFPGYIFIESDLDHLEFHRNIQQLKLMKEGIIRELRYDNEGTEALRESEKALIERLVGKNKIMEHSIGFIEGDKIIVTEGPLMGFESQIKKIDRHKRRAEIEVEMLGQVSRVSVSLEIIKKS